MYICNVQQMKFKSNAFQVNFDWNLFCRSIQTFAVFISNECNRFEDFLNLQICEWIFLTQKYRRKNINTITNEKQNKHFTKNKQTKNGQNDVHINEKKQATQTRTQGNYQNASHNRLLLRSIFWILFLVWIMSAVFFFFLDS